MLVDDAEQQPARKDAIKRLPSQGDAAELLSAEFQKIAAEWKAAEVAYRAAKNEVRESEVNQATRAAKDHAKSREMIAAVTPPDGKAFGERALALADKYPGEDSLQVLSFGAMEFDDADTANLMIERVLRDHLQSSGIAPFLGKSRSLKRVVGAEPTKDFLSKVLAANPRPLERAHAFCPWAK